MRNTAAVITLACLGLSVSAKTVALWPMGWDVAKQCRDGHCVVDPANDLSFDPDLVCTYLTDGWGWTLPPNPDPDYPVENTSALYSQGTSTAANYAYSRLIGKYLTADRDFTLEGWFRFPTLPTSPFFVADCGGLDTDGHRWFLTFRPPDGIIKGYNWQIYFQALNTGNVVLHEMSNEEAVDITKGWHHWAIVFEHLTANGTARIAFYQDGRMMGSVVKPAYLGMLTGNRFFGLGCRNKTGNAFTGFIDYCRLSDCALEPRQFLCGTKTPRSPAMRVLSLDVDPPAASGFADASLEPIPVSFPPIEYRDPICIRYQTGASIALAPNGRIWVAIMTGGKDECNLNYVDLVTSGDGGRTWSEPKLALDINGPLRTFDPAMWTDPEGRVWLFWCQCYDFWDGRGGLWTSICERPDDENATWSAPRRLCDGVMKDKPLVLANGDRWLFVEQWQDDTALQAKATLSRLRRMPEWYRTDTPHVGANVYCSKDRGDTWKWLSTVPVPTSIRTCDEHMAVELKNGTFRMLLRVKTGMAESTSADGGRTWTTAAESGVRNPAGRFFFGRLRSGNILLVKNGPVDRQTGRRDLMAFLSEDDGKTFPYRLELDMRTGVAYPDVSERSDGLIHCIHDFDRRNAAEIILDQFTEDDIRAGRLVSPQSRLHTVVRKNPRAALTVSAKRTRFGN